MRGGILVILGLCFSWTALAVDWDPIPEDQLSISKPRIDPEADAEAIFWRVWITDKIPGGQQPQSVKEQYLRIKIFTERGVKDQSTIDLVSNVGNIRIGDLRARTIKPNGRIIELEKSSVFERTVARAGGLRYKMKAFSMPGVEPGDIIEYQWKQFHDNHFAQYSRLYLQRDIPNWSVNYNIKPNAFAYEYLKLSMKSQTFNMPNANFEEIPGGFYSATWEDVGAFTEENRMPPEDHVRSWLLLFYSRGLKVDADKYWVEHGKEIYNDIKNEMKIDGSIKKKAAELTAGVSDPEEKVEKIREFCLTGIKNIYHDLSGMTAEDRQSVKDNKKPADTLKQGMGTGHDINMLFAALLNSIDIDARWAKCGGRDDSFFNTRFMDPYFLNRAHVAVKLGEAWKFYDLAIPYLEPGMLSWPEEGVQTLISDPKNPVFIETPFSGPDRNRTIRKANLKLLADGSLEGTVEQTYLGHPGVSQKSAYDGQTEEEREKELTESVQRRLDTAELSDIEFENVTDLKKPYSVRYSIKVPGYAERTGKRLFLQPAYFRRNSRPEFSTSERKFDLYFEYSWSELDEVSIALPEGYELENPEAPASHDMPGVGAYNVQLAVGPNNELVYSRDFRFGENGNILFPAKVYPQLKQVFDIIHEMDSHVVILRVKGSDD